MKIEIESKKITSFLDKSFVWFRWAYRLSSASLSRLEPFFCGFIIAAWKLTGRPYLSTDSTNNRNAFMWIHAVNDSLKLIFSHLTNGPFNFLLLIKSSNFFQLQGEEEEQKFWLITNLSFLFCSSVFICSFSLAIASSSNLNSLTRYFLSRHFSLNVSITFWNRLTVTNTWSLSSTIFLFFKISFLRERRIKKRKWKKRRSYFDDLGTTYSIRVS